MKTTCKKALSVNLLQVSDLTLDPCLKVEWVIILKLPYICYIFVIGLGLGMENLVGSLYFLELKLFLKFFSNLDVVAQLVVPVGWGYFYVLVTLV